MAAAKAYMLNYMDIVPTGNLDEFIIVMNVVVADPDSFRVINGTPSVQFVFGTDTNSKIVTAIRDFATDNGITVPASNVFLPTYTAN